VSFSTSMWGSALGSGKPLNYRRI